MNIKEKIKKIHPFRMKGDVYVKGVKDPHTINLFNETGLKIALKQLGWYEKDGKLFDMDGKRITCYVCKRRLNKGDISSFFPCKLYRKYADGTKHHVAPLCEKDECFVVASYKLEKLKDNKK